VALVGAQVLMAEVGELQRVAGGGQEAEELTQLRVIGSDRVRAAVRLQLKPADVFVRGGLQIVGHVEAACMLPHPATGAGIFDMWADPADALGNL
jgi:hypothetical protein